MARPACYRDIPGGTATIIHRMTSTSEIEALTLKFRLLPSSFTFAHSDDECNQDFAPTINHHSCTRKQVTQLTANVRRQGGRKAHETAVIPIIPTRYTTVVASWTPETRLDTSAPVRLKTTPAYAHSFNRGKRGMIIAIEPRIFQIPKMTRK